MCFRTDNLVLNDQLGAASLREVNSSATAVISASSSLSRVGRYKSSPSDVSLFTSIALVQVFFRQRCCENGNSRLWAWLHPELIKTQVGGYVYEKDPLLYSW